MKSNLFHSDERRAVESRIRKFLNSMPDVLSSGTAKSTRAAGDAIQEALSREFEGILGSKNCTNYSENFARRAMADLAFSDPEGLYYVVDVKTHRMDTKFNMPNLISVERLARFYQEDRNYFVVLMVSYEVEGVKINADSVYFVPIEFLNWDCLTIGALGWGQIQIANSNNILIDDRMNRRRWMLKLCDVLLDFYPREIGKINDRITHFEEVKAYWQGKGED